MSRTQYFCAASLDGFIAEPDDTLEWLTKYEGSFEGQGAEPMKGTYERFYDGVGALVMGSATYEFVLAELSEWPYQGKPTWILTSRELPEPEGEDVDVRIGKGSIHELVGDMLVVVAGSFWVWLDGVRHHASPRQAVLVEKGRRHRLLAREEGVRYLTRHVRRPPLQIRAPNA